MDHLSSVAFPAHLTFHSQAGSAWASVCTTKQRQWWLCGHAHIWVLCSDERRWGLQSATQPHLVILACSACCCVILMRTINLNTHPIAAAHPREVGCPVSYHVVCCGLVGGSMTEMSSGLPQAAVLHGLVHGVYGFLCLGSSCGCPL